LITSSGREQNDIASALEAALASVEESLTLRKIRGQIDRLAVSADAKALLMDIASMTVQVGEWIVAIGRKIVSFALDLSKRFPNTAFGIVIALVLGALVASAFGGIPLVGAVLVAKLQAIILLFGIAKGAMADMSLTSVGGEVDIFVKDLNPLAVAF
jgi:hypothetical protein